MMRFVAVAGKSCFTISSLMVLLTICWLVEVRLSTRIFLKECLFVVYLVAMTVSGDLTKWFVPCPSLLRLFSFDFFLVTTVQSVKLYFLLRETFGNRRGVWYISTTTLHTRRLKPHSEI